jgi:hypothetical protein
LNALNGLFRDAAQKMGITIEMHLIDETVQLVVPEKVMRKWAIPGVPTLVGLVGVQTNQFPRAVDLARRFKKLGAMVIIGGFHVSGSLALLGLTPELQQLREEGISLFAGEIEGRTEELLTDALQGKLKSIYWLGELPDLSKEWAAPLVDHTVARRFMLPYAGTMDTSRGCVFKCSFCTIIHVQGNSMRYRSPELIEKHVRQHYPRIKHYFFTDDNMSRNPRWREIFERLIQMREQEDIRITFMMQVDVPSYRIPDFVDLAARAGCSQVFIGLESLNPENLKAASKGQNKLNFFEEMIQAWHRYGIAVHTSYIIGFPFDTVESVRRDITTLMEVVQPDQASFFMLTPPARLCRPLGDDQTGRMDEPRLQRIRQLPRGAKSSEHDQRGMVQCLSGSVETLLLRREPDEGAQPGDAGIVLGYLQERSMVCLRDALRRGAPHDYRLLAAERAYRAPTCLPDRKPAGVCLATREGYRGAIMAGRQADTHVRKDMACHLAHQAYGGMAQERRTSQGGAGATSTARTGSSSGFLYLSAPAHGAVAGRMAGCLAIAETRQGVASASVSERYLRCLSQRIGTAHARLAVPDEPRSGDVIGYIRRLTVGLCLHACIQQGVFNPTVSVCRPRQSCGLG